MQTHCSRCHREIVARNHVEEGMIYLQISRGVDDRDFIYPKEAKPTFSMFTQTKKVLENPYAKSGISVISLPDWRWERRDIKDRAIALPDHGQNTGIPKGGR